MMKRSLLASSIVDPTEVARRHLVLGRRPGENRAAHRARLKRERRERQAKK